MNHPTPTSRLVGASQCTHLRHKGMYVTTPHGEDPGVASYAGATAFWCTCTMKGLGPDGEPVSLDRCTMGGGRACCAVW
jgi:hypothetical protein